MKRWTFLDAQLYLRTAVSGKENGERVTSVLALSDLMRKVTKKKDGVENTISAR